MNPISSYTYILNHTELVPLQPEAPEPVFWNEKALKLKILGESANQVYNEFSKTSRTKPKENDYKKIVMLGTQQPKIQQTKAPMCWMRLVSVLMDVVTCWLHLGHTRVMGSGPNSRLYRTFSTPCGQIPPPPPPQLV